MRPEIASLDLEEELLRIGGLFARALVTASMLALAAAGAMAFFADYLWQGASPATTLRASAFFALAGAFAAWRLARTLRRTPHLSAAGKPPGI